MKEIDFLPEWYRSGRRKQAGYTTQYIVIGCIFSIAVVWNGLTMHSISRAAADISKKSSLYAQGQKSLNEYAELKKQISQLRKKASELDNIKTKIDIAGVLAETSFLVDDNITLGKLEFKAEKFEQNENKSDVSGAVRTVKNVGSDTKYTGPVRFKVVLGGMARDAGGVAKLICRLEESPYFWRVLPLFSRNMENKTDANKSGTDMSRVSEFEISGYIENYREDAQSPAAKTQSVSVVN